MSCCAHRRSAWCFRLPARRCGQRKRRTERSSRCRERHQGYHREGDSAELLAVKAFEIKGADLPWTDLGLDAARGQQVTFLLGGRMWLSRDDDLWSALAWSSTRGRVGCADEHPMLDTGTMTAFHDGRIEVAIGRGMDHEDGALERRKTSTRRRTLRSPALPCCGAETRCRRQSLLAHGDVGGLSRSNSAHLERGGKLPAGWSTCSALAADRTSSIRAPTAR